MRGGIYNATLKPVKSFLEVLIWRVGLTPRIPLGFLRPPKGDRVLPWQSLGKEYPPWLALRPVIASARTECFASLPISQTGADPITHVWNAFLRPAPSRLQARCVGTNSFAGYARIRCRYSRLICRCSSRIGGRGRLGYCLSGRRVSSRRRILSTIRSRN